MRMYMPKEWTDDRPRCAKVGVPDEVMFKTKPEIALDHIDNALRWGMRKRVVLADAGFGDNTDFRAGLQQRGLDYVVGIQTTIKVWAPGTSPISPEQLPQKPTGRPRTRHATGEQKPLTVLELAMSLGRKNLKTLTWREGVKGPQHSRFAAARVRTAHHHSMGAPPGPEVWLLWAWPTDAEKPNKFWLSNLPATTSLKRDYQEMKGELGLDHYEGRTWRGWHHHCALVAVAHAFLTLQRVLSPPILPDVDAA
jgi:SRSO17 transposase